jgi:hypothetical protein
MPHDIDPTIQKKKQCFGKGLVQDHICTPRDLEKNHHQIPQLLHLHHPWLLKGSSVSCRLTPA